jgi:hypothetical protein
MLHGENFVLFSKVTQSWLFGGNGFLLSGSFISVMNFTVIITKAVSPSKKEACNKI